MKSARFFKGLGKDHARESHSIIRTLSEQYGSKWEPPLAIAPTETGAFVGVRAMPHVNLRVKEPAALSI
jgi:hypothetical protein